ncbi:PREDICTED: uncharacterized protein LOC106821114 [Priapulus caudatus]|uniref:Uncharacterized protein LOC106821114 n=1 Tax=Priapulus caudatus TaxID=37621 RepID=A0ABM1FA04_PRICU|nr:PREDICTED: uncharacterized protein LOC106821114 [Priapulus caudatus]
MSREGSSSEDKSPLRSFQSWDDTDVKRLELEFNLSLAEAVEFLFNKSRIAEEQAASAVQTSRRVDESVDWYLNARDVKIHQNTPTNSPINSHMGAGTPYSDRCSAKTPSEEAGGVFDDYADGEQTTQKPIEILELNEDAAKSASLASDFVAQRVNSERDSIREAKLVERGQLLDGMDTEKRGNLAAYAVLHPDMESKTCSLRKEDSDLTVVGATQETISPTYEERTAQAHSISKVEWLKEKRAFLDELNIVKEERNKISAALKQMKDKHIKENAEALKNMALTTDLLIIEQKKSEEAIQPLKAALVEKCNMVEELKKEASELRVKIKSNQERKESNEELRRQIRHLEMTQEREISSMRDRLQQEKAKDMEAMRKLLLKDHVEQIRTVQAKARSQQYELQLQEREAELARLKEVMQKWKSDALTKMEEEMAR